MATPFRRPSGRLECYFYFDALPKRMAMLLNPKRRKLLNARSASKQKRRPMAAFFEYVQLNNIISEY